MREQRTTRDGAALFSAVLLHVGVLALIARVGMPQAPTAPATQGAHAIEDALDVDLVAEGAETATTAPGGQFGAERPKDEPSRLVRAGARPGSHGAAAEHARERGPVAALEVGETAVLAPGAPVGASADSAAPVATSAPAIDLGLGADGWKRWLASDHSSNGGPHAPAPGAPIVKAPPASTTGGLQEGLLEADLKRVVGPSGRVVNALEDAAHGDGATAFGVARFAVTVLRTGGVEVRLESASAGEAEWKRVAERAAESLRANPPRIRPPSDGARFLVDLSAEMLLVDGRHVRSLHGPRVEATPPRIHSWAAGQHDMLRDNPTAASGVSRTDQMRAIVEIPGVYVAQNGKVCSYRFGLSLLGPLAQGGCELSNLGTKPQRVVHAHVTREELF